MAEVLKTLKDFELTSPDFQDWIQKELTVEAVKWVKELEEHEEDSIFACPQEWDSASTYNVREWIKHFFNITDEDLK
jgi:hypothetical protein